MIDDQVIKIIKESKTFDKAIYNVNKWIDKEFKGFEWEKPNQEVTNKFVKREWEAING